MSDFMQLFSDKIAFSKTIFNFPDVLLPRPLSPRFGITYHRITVGYYQLKLLRREIYTSWAISLLSYFFFHLSWYNAVHFKRNVATKTTSILTQKIGEPNSTTFSKGETSRAEILMPNTMFIFSQVMKWKVCDHFKIATPESQENYLTNSSHSEE